MIPKEDLEKIKPYQDYINRKKMIRGKLTKVSKKFHLTKTQRSHHGDYVGRLK